MLKTAKLWEKRFGKKAKFVSFNIPRLRSSDGQVTCPYDGTCADICYAGQGRMIMAASIQSRERNLAHINRISFSSLRDKVAEDVRSMDTVTHIRIHDSGDFFSRPYYHAWIEIAEMCPKVIFYAYTKSIPFLEWDNHPSNFRIVQSLGGSKDYDIDLNRPHAKIFATEQERKMQKYCDGNSSDIPAVLGYNRIGLVYHGNKKLTEENLIQLRI